MPFGLGFFATAGGAAPVAVGDYDLLTTTTVGTAVASITIDVSTYTAYKHLQLRIAANSSNTNANNLYLRFNADSAGNYNGHYLVGTGSQVLSGATTNTTELALGIITGTQSGAAVIDILDAYASKNKTVRALTGNTTSTRIDLMSGLWRSTNSLTSIYLAPSVGNWIIGSRMSLYGLRG